MQITFTQEGGLAYFPGLTKPVTIDTEKLSPPDAEQIDRLVKSARLFDLPAQVGQAARGAADYRKYTVTVQDGDRRHTVHIIEPVADAELQALLGKLRELARPAR